MMKWIENLCRRFPRNKPHLFVEYGTWYCVAGDGSSGVSEESAAAAYNEWYVSKYLP